MQRYGQIYVLCVATERPICIFMRKLGLIFSQMHVGRFSHKCVQADFLTRVRADFLTNAGWQIFSQMCVGRFSHKCMLADFLTNACWQIFSQMRVGRFSHTRVG